MGFAHIPNKVKDYLFGVKNNIPKERQISIIKNRIMSEYKKHGKNGLDWAEIAARKIYSELNNGNQNNIQRH